MTAPAAFEATYFTHRPIVTRQCVQLVFEVPAERLLSVLSMLQPAPGEQQVMVGIARLDPTRKEVVHPETGSQRAIPRSPDETSPQPEVRTAGGERTKREWADLPASQQAAIRCGEVDFWKFLHISRGECRNPADAADIVRIACGVKSRADLNTDQTACNRWLALDAEYQQATGRMADAR